MSARGRSAALPQGTHRRPQVLDGTGLLVRHVNEKGDAERTFDFGRLLVAEPLQRSLAALFAERVGPEGTWRNLATSREAWTLLGTFTVFLARQEHPPRDLDELSPAVWAAWQVSRPRTSMGDRQITKVAAFLREDSRIPEATLALLWRRGRPRRASSEVAYTPEPFGRLKTAATRSFRAALHRVRGNQQDLLAWREGRVRPGSDAWLVGEALDHLARTGDVPHYYRSSDGTRVVSHRHARALGGSRAEFTWQRLFLSSTEIVSLAVLLIAAHGWNATSVSELRIPSVQPDPGLDGKVTHRLELEKRRRHPPHRYETRNLTDWGADSPGRLISQALEVTAPARTLLAAAGSVGDRLLVWHVGRWPRGTPAGALFRAGITESQVREWPQVEGEKLNLRRLRKTAVSQHRRTATQHSQDVHDAVYVLPDPQTRERAAPVIAQGITDALDHARATFTARVADTAPDGQDTALAACTDYTRSPFSPHGSPCRASFLLCTACPNAVVTRRRLPRLAHLHHVLGSLRGVLPAAVWDHDWREHHQRLTDLQRALSDSEWNDAHAAATAEDREAVDRLLNRGFDA